MRRRLLQYIQDFWMWNFASSNPGYSFLIVFVVCLTVCSLWRRAMKTLAIRTSGWPPPHLDADGDFRPTDE
jgi:hypothetical protein